jgi:hypothetical protein
MFAFFANPLAAGRSEVSRGVAAAVIAPTVGYVLIAVPLFVAVIWGFGAEGPRDLSQLASGVALLGLTFLKVLATALIVGVPVWLVLRWLRRESGGAYAMLGGLAGIVAGPGGSPLRLFHPGQGSGLAIYGLGGVLIGLVFWLIARAPASAQPITGTAS